MRKIKALFINEIIKISQKVSVLVILSIMVIGVVGFGTLIKMQEVRNPSTQMNTRDDSWVYPEMQSQVSILQGNLQSMEQKLPLAADTERMGLENEIARTKDQIEIYQLAIDKKIPLLGNSDYRAEALNNVISLRSDLRNLEKTSPSERSEAENVSIQKIQALIDRYFKIASNQDFREFQAIRQDEIQANTTWSDAKKKIFLESNALWYKLDPSGGLSDQSKFEQIRSGIYQIENLKLSLLENINYENVESSGLLPLTPAERVQTKNKLAVLTYQMENYISTENYNFTNEAVAMQGMLWFGSFMIVILMMILSGSSVSQEIATGSIKSLIISPTKRWKIFTAKALALLSVGLAAIVLLYVFSVLTHGVLFGFSSGSSYIYANNGVVGELGFYLYKILFLLVGFIDVIFYMALAFMLSIITRNTAAAVGISIATFFGGGIISTLLAIFSKGEWLKFIPFNNLSFAADIFPFDASAQLANNFIMGGRSGMINPPLLFSLVYLVVAVICIGYIALDSFNRRDIK